MLIEKLVLGELKTNCYIISHNDTVIVIDPACDGETIDAFISKKNSTVKAIFLTHGHNDHIGATDYLVNKYNCTVYAHINDADFVSGSNLEIIDKISELNGIKVTSRVNYFRGEFNSFDIDGITIDAILTSGHSRGSVTYVLRKYNRIFSGDTLFKNGVGRTDFPSSSVRELKASLEIYKNFKEDCKVYPGHGESTTIGQEKENNMYL